MIAVKTQSAAGFATHRNSPSSELPSPKAPQQPLAEELPSPNCEVPEASTPTEEIMSSQHALMMAIRKRDFESYKFVILLLADIRGLSPKFLKCLFSYNS
jgi:hypothetical protein